MIIILEGPDGAGKSTLADALAERLPGAGRLHSGPLREDPFRAYETRLDLWDRAKPLIIDRWHLGELIYGPMLRGESKLDAVGRWHIEAYLSARGAVQIMVMPDVETLVSRIGVRGDDLVDASMLEQIRTRYKVLVDSKANNLSTLGFETPNVIDYIDDIIGDARAFWLEAAALRQFTTYVGDPTVDYLLLGERRNDPSYSAAFVPTGASSGRFMLEHLLPALGEKTIGVANACEEDVTKLWYTLGQPKIVTLGNTSTVEASRDLAGVTTFGSVPHPQYIRRFHNKSGALYARTILSALETREDLRSWRPA